MLLNIIRALFILVIASVGWSFVVDPRQILGTGSWSFLAISLVVGTLFLCVDILAPRNKLQAFAGTFFGLLVGLVISWAMSFVNPLLVDQLTSYFPSLVTDGSLTTQGASFIEKKQGLVDFLNLIVGCVACFLSIAVVLQTKDDFRFIIPYVEFSKQTKGARPILLDTSVLIDGRICDIAKVGLFDIQLIVPRFVLRELQAVADSADRLKRNRGRRGLDVLADLQKVKGLDVVIYEASHHTDGPVDQLLMSLAKELGARVLTIDFNLNKVAQLTGVDVININDLANALKPEVLPGEPMKVRIIRPGEEAHQGVGFLDDGTMVVVEGGKASVGDEVSFLVTNTRQTSAGRMIFGRIPEGGEEASGSSSQTTPSSTSASPSPSQPQRRPHHRNR
jgi:uncharacterized protein YacL